MPYNVLEETPSKLWFALWQEMVSSTVVNFPRDRRDYASCCNCKEEGRNIAQINWNSGT